MAHIQRFDQINPIVFSSLHPMCQACIRHHMLEKNLPFEINCRPIKADAMDFDKLVDGFLDQGMEDQEAMWAAYKIHIPQFARDILDLPSWHPVQDDLFMCNATRITGRVHRRAGKALALDTPILTIGGWKTMGTLEVGDRVYGLDGTPTRVEYTSEIFFGNRCYDVEFSDGSIITADAGHLWTLWHTNTGGKGKVRQTITTTELAGQSCKWASSNSKDDYCYRVPVPTVDPLEMKRKPDQLDLPKNLNQHNWVRLVDVREVQSVPTRCIQVDHPDHLYLAGPTLIPTHNTVGSRVKVIHRSMFTDTTILVVAPYEDQVDEFFGGENGGLEDIILRAAKKNPWILDWVIKPKGSKSGRLFRVKPRYKMDWITGAHIQGKVLRSTNAKRGSSARGLGVVGLRNIEDTTVDPEDVAGMVVIDESDFLEPSDWATINPIIEQNTNIEAIEMSTPAGKREAYFSHCVESSNHREIFYPITKRPDIVALSGDEQRRALERIRRTCQSEDEYVREWLAGFGLASAAVFRPEDLQACSGEGWDYSFKADTNIHDFPVREKPRDGRLRMLGVDWNRPGAGVRIYVCEFVPGGIDGRGYYKFMDRLIVANVEFTQLSAADAIICANRKWRPEFIYCDAGFGDCVDPETRITTPYGNIPIRLIQVGDRVMALDGRYHTVTGKVVREDAKPVFRVKTRMASVVVSNTHPFYIRRMDGAEGWRNVTELALGDELATPNSYDRHGANGLRFAPIIAIDPLPAMRGLIDIEVQGASSFVGNGLALHNTQIEKLKLFGLHAREEVGMRHPDSQLPYIVKAINMQETVSVPDPAEPNNKDKARKISEKALLINFYQAITQERAVFFNSYERMPGNLIPAMNAFKVERINPSGHPVYTGENDHDLIASGLALYAFWKEYHYTKGRSILETAALISGRSLDEELPSRIYMPKFKEGMVRRVGRVADDDTWKGLLSQNKISEEPDERHLQKVAINGRPVSPVAIAAGGRRGSFTSRSAGFSRRG